MEINKLTQGSIQASWFVNCAWRNPKGEQELDRIRSLLLCSQFHNPTDNQPEEIKSFGHM